MSFKMIKEEKTPWYRDGLRFQCTGCGGCCSKEPGYVWVSEEEIILIARFLNISIDDLAEKHLRLAHGAISLREDPKNYDCTFLKDNRCTIYPVRPTQCKTFPWWKENLIDQCSWNETAQRCEGIHDDANLVSLEEIQANLIEK